MPIENFETRHKAITNDGQIYSYILKYFENLSKLNYFVKEEESIGNEMSRLMDSLKVKETLKDKNNKSTYYKRFSEYLLKSKLYPIETKRNKGMVLRLLKVAYNKEEVYLVLEIRNHSGIDFEIDYLNIYSLNENNNVRVWFQRLEQEVIFKYELPDVVMNNHSSIFVYVLPKFVLGSSEKLCVELQELKGNRKISLDY